MAEKVRYVCGYELVERAGSQITQKAIDEALKINSDVGSFEYMQTYLQILLGNPHIRLMHVARVVIGGTGESNLYGILG